MKTLFLVLFFSSSMVLGSDKKADERLGEQETEKVDIRTKIEADRKAEIVAGQKAHEVAEEKRRKAKTWTLVDQASPI